MAHDNPNHSSVDDVVELSAIWHGLQRQLGVFSAVGAITFLAFAIYAFGAQKFFTAETSIIIESQSGGSGIATERVLSAGANVPVEVDTEIELLRSRAMAIRVVQRLRAQVGDEVFSDEPVTVTAPAPDDDLTIERLSVIDLEVDADSIDQALQAQAAASDEAGSAEDGLEIEFFSGGDETAPQENEFAVENAQTPTIETLVGSDVAVTQPDADEIVPSEYVNQLMNGLEVARVGTTYLVRIQYSSPSPENAALIANAFADEYILQQLEAQFEALQQASRWIGARLEVLRDEVRASEEAAANFRAEYGLVDADGTNVNEQRIAQLATELSTARTQLSAAIARYQSVDSTIKSGQPIEAINEVMESPVVRDLRHQQATVMRRRGELRARYGDLHPEMKQVNQELQDLDRQIDIEINRIVQNLEREVSYAQVRVRTLAQDLNELQGDMATENPTLVRLRELERDTLASRGLYESLLERQKELNELERLAQADARIILRASPPDWPSWPNTSLLLAAGGTLALLFSSIAAFIAEAMETRITNSGDLRRAFGGVLPIVLIPKIVRRKIFYDQDLAEFAESYIIDKPSSTFADSFRELRMHLMLAMDDDNKDGGVSIAFTPSFEGEGATMTSFCFATLLASEGARVLLVDADLVNDPEVSDYSEPKRNIFSSSLQRLTDKRRSSENDSELDTEFIYDVAAEPASNSAEVAQILPDDGDENECKAVSTVEPAAIANSSQFRLFRTVNDVDIALLSENKTISTKSIDGVSIDSLLENMSGLYDYIIIDSPPVLERSEASYLASRADYVVLLAEWRRTTREAVATTCRALIDAHANFLGFAINKVDARRRHHFRPEDRKFYFSRKKNR